MLVVATGGGGVSSGVGEARGGCGCCLTRLLRGRFAGSAGGQPFPEEILGLDPKPLRCFPPNLCVQM